MNKNDMSDSYIHQLTEDEIEYFRNGNLLQKRLVCILTFVFLISYGSLFYLIYSDYQKKLDSFDSYKEMNTVCNMFSILGIVFVLCIILLQFKAYRVYKALRDGNYEFYISKIIKKRVVSLEQEPVTGQFRIIIVMQ